MKKILTIFSCMLLTISLLNAQNGGNKLSLIGADPTEVRDRLDIIIGEAEFTSSRNLFAFSVQGYKTIYPWLSIGSNVPLIYSYNEFDEDKFTVGDINVGLMASLYSHQGSSVYSRVAFGFKYSLNTGDPDIQTGLGQKVLIPRLNAIFQTSDGDAFVAPVIEYYYSIDNNPLYLAINKLSLRIQGTIDFNGSWITLMPMIRWDFNHIYTTTYYISSSLGKMMNKNFGLSFDFIYRFAGEPDFDYLARLSMRFLF